MVLFGFLIDSKSFVLFGCDFLSSVAMLTTVLLLDEYKYFLGCSANLQKRLCILPTIHFQHSFKPDIHQIFIQHVIHNIFH